MSASPSYGEPRSSVIRWIAHIGDDVPPELRLRLLSNIFASKIPLLMGSINNVTVTLVAYYRLESPVLLTLACLECVLLAARLMLLRRHDKPTDLLFVGGLLWVSLQAVTIWLVVRSGDVPSMIVVLATSLAVIGGIIARNFATPRYAFAQVLAIDLTFKTAFLSVNPTFAPLILAQTLIFVMYNLTSLKQHREMALRAMRAEIESREQAFTDPLTKLANRRGLAAQADRMAAKEDSLVLFYIDLDGFKGVNDRLGHGAGDSLLQEVGTRLKGLFSDRTAICRLGGDEFLVLGSHSGDDEIRACGARIVAALSVPYATEENSLALIGASVGAARWKENGGSLELCMAAADGALYRAKADGKGRCAIADTTPPVASDGRAAA